MLVLEKQIVIMREIFDQLITMFSDLAYDHNKETLEFEGEFQKMVIDTFDIFHGQNMSSIITAGGPGPIITAPQLPVLALKPDLLSFSMSTADLRIWKEAYRSYHHRASEFDRYTIFEQQAFLFRCLNNEVAIRLQREATNTTYLLKRQHGVMWINSTWHSTRDVLSIKDADGSSISSNRLCMYASLSSWMKPMLTEWTKTIWHVWWCKTASWTPP